VVRRFLGEAFSYVIHMLWKLLATETSHNGNIIRLRESLNTTSAVNITIFYMLALVVLWCILEIKFGKYHYC